MSLALNLLKRLDPETAHAMALKALACGLGPKRGPLPRGQIHLLGCQLPTALGLAGGADKTGAALQAWADMGLGFVEVGTITPDAREGNPRPRIWRLENGEMVNWMGLNSPGVKAVAANLQRFRRHNSTFCLGASLANPSKVKEGLTPSAELLAPWVNFFTFNASCPNVAGHQAHDALAPILKEVAEVIAGAAGKPVLVKLGPTDALKATADVLMQAGVVGFICCNTIPPDKRHLLHTPVDWPQRDGNFVGGYSGPQLLPISVAMITTLRQHLGKDVPLIGVGGVQAPADAKSLIRAGASAIQLYAGLTMHGVRLLDDIRSEVALMLT